MARREIFFATCQPGLEPALHREAKQLKLAKVEQQVGGVYFEGRVEDAWRANLWFRTAIRVLWRVARFEAADGDALYDGAKPVDWRRWIRRGATIRVDAQSSDSALTHTMFVAQRVKDAVADHMRDAGRERPDVDKDAPDVLIHAHLSRNRCTLSVDTSGESLHKRGWRVAQGRAPLSETLAAGMLLLADWNGRQPVVDPFCGSGTLLIEAALIAGGLAPGRFRERFGFEAFPGHDDAAWQALRRETLAEGAVPKKLPLRGCDIDPAAIDAARANAESAGLADRIHFETGDATRIEWTRGWNGLITSNLPYGERVGQLDDLLPLLRTFGERLRDQCAGYRVALLSGDRRLTRALELKADRLIKLTNGGLPCELLLAELW